jgi:tryptophan 2,3-dioxygenase
MQIPSMATDAMTCPYRRQLRPSQPHAPSVADWVTSRNVDEFPYDAVVAEFHRVGKHLVPAPLLEALAGVRAALPQVHGSAAGVRLLERFLDTALDKWDGRYANPTYLGLSLLPLPVVDDLDLDITAAARQYDRLLVQLIADASRFEIAAADGATELLPQMRPDARTTAKRCRLGLQVVGPAAQRLELSDGVDNADPIAGARRLWESVAGDLSPAERRTLQVSMLPVSLIHDEYQFIRVLQSFEATFALVAVHLHAAVRALGEGEADLARERIDAAATTLREAAPLFSLVATMQVAAFHTFREFTEGASAIQSRNYKLVESLCRRPEAARLDSAAYHSVPEVRQRVRDGQMTLDDALEAARTAGRLSARDIDELEQAMREFAETLLRWRRAHYRIAVRMLGERTGTGYTEGAMYLKAAMAIPVFSSLTTGHEADTPDFERGDEIATVQTPRAIATRGRCPFAA